MAPLSLLRIITLEGSNTMKRIQLKNIPSVKAVVEPSEAHERLKELLHQRKAELLRLRNNDNDGIGGIITTPAASPAPPNPPAPRAGVLLPATSTVHMEPAAAKEATASRTPAAAG